MEALHKIEAQKPPANYTFSDDDSLHAMYAYET